MTRFALVLALLAGCASRSPADSPPSEAPGDVTGTVLLVDLGPLAADGDALIEVERDDGQRVTVRVPARTNLCRAQGLGLLSELAPGDRVRVVGEPVEGGVRPCLGADHRLARVAAAAVTVRGVVETGFERSSFRPCAAPDEAWWLVPTEPVADRLAALQAEHAAGQEGRGLRMAYDATLTGDVRRGEVYGHLGQYVAEFTAREVVALDVLAVNPEAPVACPAP